MLDGPCRRCLVSPITCERRGRSATHRGAHEAEDVGVITRRDVARCARVRTLCPSDRRSCTFTVYLGRKVQPLSFGAHAGRSAFSTPSLAWAWSAGRGRPPLSFGAQAGVPLFLPPLSRGHFAAILRSARGDSARCQKVA